MDETPRDGADRVGHGEAGLGDLPSTPSPDDPDYVGTDPEPITEAPDPPGDERGNEDPAPNAP